VIENNRQKNPSEKSVREIFDESLDRAKREIETERERSRTRSPFVKFLHALLITAAISVVFTFAYGIYNFPDAPLRLKDNGEYRGKSGKLHTQQEYENFKLWETTLLVVFPALFIFAFAFHIADSREKNRQADKI
jgi:hypothetical protein